MNGKMKWILTLTGFIFVMLTTSMSYTWGSVTQNREDISEIKECLSAKMETVLQRLARIEAILEK